MSDVKVEYLATVHQYTDQTGEIRFQVKRHCPPNGPGHDWEYLSALGHAEARALRDALNALDLGDKPTQRAETWATLEDPIERTIGRVRPGHVKRRSGP